MRSLMHCFNLGKKYQLKPFITVLLSQCRAITNSMFLLNLVKKPSALENIADSTLFTAKSANKT